MLLDSGGQRRACPTKYPAQRVQLPDPGIRTASGARFQHDEERPVTLTFPEGRTNPLLFHVCEVQKSILSLGRLAQQGYGSDLCADTGTLFLPDNIQTQHSQTQLHKDENLFFVKGMLMAPLVTAGVSDDVTQELQMPMGQQTLDDAEEPTPARPATLKDPGTLDQIVLDQHSVTHFPSQPWCKMCVDREQSKIDAVVPQLRFADGYLGDGGPLQIACFLVGSGAIHATMVRDSKNMDMPHVVAGTAKRVRDLGYERVCLHGVKEAVLQLLLGKVAKECRPQGQDWQIHVSPTQSHQGNGAAEKAVTTCSNISCVSQRQNLVI